MIRILFVCLGNICRSPSAEAVMNGLIDTHDVAGEIMCDSAGTCDLHVGQAADQRMQRHARQRNIELTSIGRQLQPRDFVEFDYIIGMDESNMYNIRALAADGSAAHENKIKKMTDYCIHLSVNEVPDPYFGGAAGFEQVLDILADACAGLLAEIQSAKP